MLTGSVPFHPLRDPEIAYKVIKGERPAIDPSISDGLRQLLVRCWHPDSTQRPQIDEILHGLYNDPSRGSIFPPSLNHPASSCESLVSDTQKYGNYSWFEPVFQCAYSCIGDMFVTADPGDIPPTPIEIQGTFGARL